MGGQVHRVTKQISLSLPISTGTCTNFLELFIQHLQLLWAEGISFQESVKRKRKYVLRTMSQRPVKKVARLHGMMVGAVLAELECHICLCSSAMPLQGREVQDVRGMRRCNQRCAQFWVMLQGVKIKSQSLWEIVQMFFQAHTNPLTTFRRRSDKSMGEQSGQGISWAV